ncbi:hypothetical protein [Saccharopolyspora sp. NPDC049426]|uniref:hypothetical protein n=1 Tax=Saccharopolyspora sp. NPDC049426 TaxID=3155652 RepID=UPI00342535F7
MILADVEAPFASEICSTAAVRRTEPNRATAANAAIVSVRHRSSTSPIALDSASGG